jgi:hypothetical protein
MDLRWQLQLFLGGAFCLGLCLMACGGSKAASDIPEPPGTVEVGWDRIGMESPPVEQSPEAILSLNPRRRLRISYRNYVGTTLVEAFLMPSQASAFEAEQKWRKEPGSVAFHRGKLFVICSSPTEPTGSVLNFSRNLEKAWLGPPQ